MIDNDEQNANGRETAPLYRFSDDSLRGALARQWGASPWYVGSFGLHMLVFAILLLFAPEPQRQNVNKVKIDVGEVEEEPVVEDPPDDPDIIDEPDLVDEKVEVDPLTEIPVPDIQIENTVDNADPTEEPAKTDVSDFATEADYDVPMTLGVNATFAGSSHCGGPFSTRGDPHKTRPVKGGPGGQKHLDALALGLRWLASVQEEDGHWDSAKYQGKGRDPAVTALALLAFLGDGNSSHSGKYKKTVRAGQEWLANKFNKGERTIGGYQYEAAVTLMAMAEAWGMGGDAELAPIVQAQVDLAMEKQSDTGGWGYKPLKDHVAAHVDTSVAGWWVMALKSAKVAGASVSEACWDKAAKYFEQGTFTENGQLQSGYNQPLGNKSHAANLTAVSLACLQFLGKERGDPRVRGQAQTLLRNHWIMGQSKGYDGVADGGKTNYYGWYYQSLGLFQYGMKSQEWKTLESRMSAILVDLQEKRGFNRGSWSPENGKDPGWGYEQAIGRVGVTATACLILEVYYRFANVHDHKR